ncbi:MAG: UvrD-helicase domain-containing protein, partial [Spirochaetaceae bacterium]|nr:UvrD-helicase domain-containing protein [Spirochaetaceae bacterium]
MNADFSYLDILEKKLDKSQRAACCRNLNTVVAAGAGSGKTQVLATRFAWLVMSCGIKVDEILALTFTKKAASEIYQRIYKTLGQFAANAQTPPEEKARAKQDLKDFYKAHIQTLDSYSSTVVRQAANRYGINPNFT